MTAPKKLVPVFVIPPLPIETARSYVIRSCMENGWPSLRLFLKRIGLKRTELLSGRQPDVVAACLGLSLEDFSRLAGTWNRTQVNILGNPFSLVKTSKFDRQVCRHCLASSEVAPFEWELEFISDCPEHGPLTKLCECGRPLTWGDRHLGLCDACTAGVHPAPRKAAPAPLRYPFQQYILGRMRRRDPSVCLVLDDLPVEACVDVCRALGELAERGYSPLAERPTLPADQIRRAEIGFAWLTREDEPGDLVEVVNAYRRTGADSAPHEPIAALGFISDLAALHMRGSDHLVELLKQRLGKAMGFPVTDLWQTDYLDARYCQAATRLEVASFIRILNDNGWRSSCITFGGDLFVPVDILWHVTQIVRAARQL